MQRKICSALSNAAQVVREKAAPANLSGEVGRADKVLKWGGPSLQMLEVFAHVEQCLGGPCF
jgi:hypothetical protein